MAKSNALKMKLPSVDDLFSTEETRQETKLAKIYDIPISEIDDFPDHPYRVLDDEDMQALTDSIKERGVITPAMVRRKENGRYEMISGHRRKKACELLGLKTLRCEVVDVNREEAIILMVDSNSQRSVIAPCDKGRAYKMKLEAIKRMPGRPKKDNSATVLQNYDGKTSREKLAEESPDCHEQIRKYIRLTYLVPELQQFVDEGKIKMRPAVELSYLDEETQRDVVDRIDETEAFPSHSQTIRIRKAFEEGKMNYEKVTEIMAEEKPNQKAKFRLAFERIKPLIPEGFEDKRAEEYIVKALEHYKKYLQKQRDQAR